MSQSASTPEPIPAVPHIKLDAGGASFVEARRCRACGAALLDEPLACPACGARKGFDAIHVAETGTLVAYSIVRRSFPGVETPFVSAIVELDDGPTVKANLTGAGFEPEEIPSDLRVRLKFNDAHGRKDKEGRAYIGYEFEPVER